VIWGVNCTISDLVSHVLRLNSSPAEHRFQARAYVQVDLKLKFWFENGSSVELALNRHYVVPLVRWVIRIDSQFRYSTWSPLRALTIVHSNPWEATNVSHLRIVLYT
jgi:hypothetical protein